MENDIKKTNIAPNEVSPENIKDTPVLQSETPKKNRNYWKISTIILLIILFFAGTLYFLLSKTKINQVVQTPQQTSAPTEIISSNQIRISNTIFTYPDNWIPVFADPKTGKNLIYFATSQSDAESVAAKCADKETCEDYAFKLEDFNTYGIPQNSSIEAFIASVKHEIEIDKLQKTTIDGHDAWAGYIGDQKLVYQLIIDASSGQSKVFVAIVATATEKGRTMMTQYVSSLPSIKVTDYSKNIQAKDLTNKKGFEIEFSSSLTTDDYLLLTTILNSLVSQKDSTTYYNNFLYSTISTAEDRTGVLGYPKGDYLNYKYYLLTDNAKLQDGEYGTKQVKIKLSTPDVDNFGAYLADPKYCQQNSDCSYRSNFCTVGAFNQYHAFYTPWGCGPPDYEGLGNSEELILKNSCQSNIKVDYDSLECINNTCQATNPIPVCNP